MATFAPSLSLPFPLPIHSAHLCCCIVHLGNLRFSHFHKPSPPRTMSKTFSQSDVASHNKADSLWIVVDGDVYDVTKFQDDHPGGKKILQRVAGKDASKQFWKYH